MIKSCNDISSFQFYAMFFMSRIFGLLTYINEPGAALSAHNGSFLFLSYFIFTVLFSLPVFLFIHTSRHPIPSRFSGTSARLYYFIYSCYFLLQGALGAALLDRFAGETMFQSGGHPVLMFFFCLAVFLSSRNGCSAALRAAPLILTAAVVSFTLITAATVSYFDPVNLLPPAQTDLAGLLKNGAFAAIRTVEPAALLFLYPKIKGKRIAGFAATVFALGATASLLFTLIAGVTGAFGETQTFQFFTLTTLAELGTVERMDDILCAIWIFCAFLRTVFYLSMAEICIVKTGPRLPAVALRAGLCTVLFGIYLLLASDTFLRWWIEEQNGNIILNLLFVFLIPFACILISNIKRKAEM